MKDQLAHDIGIAILKVSPPTIVAVATTAGRVDPQWFVIIPTAIYVAVQTAYLLWRWRREARKGDGDGK